MSQGPYLDGLSKLCSVFPQVPNDSLTPKPVHTILYCSFVASGRGRSIKNPDTCCTALEAETTYREPLCLFGSYS